MKKKWIIASSVLLGIIVTIIILCFTVFTVKTVELDFRTSTKKEWNESQIVENSKIPFGKCILFMSKEGFLRNLEEKYPYLEVINIEKIFPSKMIIHVAEREELFAIEKDEKTIYLDKDFKVLNIEDESFVSEKTNAILLKNLKFEEEAQLSKFLKIDQIEMKRFYSSMLENNKTLNQICGFCKEISLEQEQNPLTNKTEVHMSIQTFSGRKIKI